MNDCTLLTIAHRLLSIIDYDVILVLAEGKVVSQGSPIFSAFKDQTMSDASREPES